MRVGGADAHWAGVGVDENERGESAGAGSSRVGEAASGGGSGAEVVDFAASVMGERRTV